MKKTEFSTILLAILLLISLSVFASCNDVSGSGREEPEASSDVSGFISDDHVIGLIPEDYEPRKEITDDYIAVFHGGSGELTYLTYIYKIDNGHDNCGFEYISAESYGMTADQTIRILDIGTVLWTDDVFPIAEENNAYDFVTLPGDRNTYTIDEFKDMFLMN